MDYQVIFSRFLSKLWVKAPLCKFVAMEIGQYLNH